MCRKRIARFLLEHEDNTFRGAFTNSHSNRMLEVEDARTQKKLEDEDARTKKKGNPDQPKQKKQKVGVYQRRSLAFTCLKPFILPDSNLGSLFNRFLKLTMTRIRYLILLLKVRAVNLRLQ